MTTNTIIQLARFNTTNTPNNAEWTNAIREPIIINQGDTISVRQAFVDSRLNSSTNIVIDIDTTISLTYYFYVMMPCDVNSSQEDDVLTTTSSIYNDGTLVSTAYKAVASDYVAFASPNGYSDSETGAPANEGDPNAVPPTFERLQGGLNTFIASGARSNPISPQNGTGGAGGFTPAINQCQATEIPMLLITNDLGAGVGSPLENTPLTRTWSYVIKAGSYSPSDLANIITKSMAEIQNDKTTTFINPYQLFGGTTSTNLNNFLIKGTAIANFNIGADSVLPNDFTGASRYNDGLVTGGSMLFSSNSPAFANDPQHTCVFSNFLVDTPFNTNYMDTKFFNYYSDYDLSNNYNVAQQFSNPIMFMPSHYAGGYGNAIAGTDDPQLYLGGTWTKSYNSAIVGATQISLEYLTETSLFQFTYLHSPILEEPLTAGTTTTDATEPIEVVKIIKTTNVNTYNKSTNFVTGNSNEADGEIKLCEQTRHSGVFFQSMEPIGFWRDIMGFDVENIALPVEKVWGLNRTMTFQKFNSITTSGYVGIENNFNTTPTTQGTGTSVPVVPNINAPAYLSPFPTTGVNGVNTYTQLLNSDQWILENYILHNSVIPKLLFTRPFYDYNTIAGPTSDFYAEYSSALNTTNPLQAIQIPLSQTNGSGHYFVEIVAYGNNVNDFVNDVSIYAVKAIVSAYYVSPNSFITMPFSDVALYEHIGDTLYLNKFRVRLLDPITMKQAAPLGPNSSVYLQLGRQLSKLALTQPT